MNRTISRKVEFKLWSLSAGRCQICNVAIYEDPTFGLGGNFSQKAHIKAVNPGGPRHDENQKDEEINTFENLMLLCADHHKLIDDNAEYYGTEKLIHIKRRHEERVRRITSLPTLRTARMVTYFYKIDNNDITHNKESFKRALRESNYAPEQDIPTNLSREVLEFERSIEIYENESIRLTKAFNRKIEEIVFDKETIAIFALAPIPLLIKLGTLINDQYDVKVFQCHRTGDKWSWRENSDTPEYIYEYPNEKLKGNKTIALNLSISANIKNERIYQVINKDVPIYKMSLQDGTSRNVISTENILNEFIEKFRQLIERIKNETSANQILIFPAIPNSIAIRIGMDIMFKTDPRYTVYDEDKSHGGFIETLTFEGDDC